MNAVREGIFISIMHRPPWTNYTAYGAGYRMLLQAWSAAKTQPVLHDPESQADKTVTRNESEWPDRNGTCVFQRQTKPVGNGHLAVIFDGQRRCERSPSYVIAYSHLAQYPLVPWSDHPSTAAPALAPWFWGKLDLLRRQNRVTASWKPTKWKRPKNSAHS